MDWQTGRWAHIQEQTHVDRKIDKYRGTNVQTDRRKEGKMDRWTDEQVGR
jgi:hypothetical protein